MYKVNIKGGAWQSRIKSTAADMHLSYENSGQYLTTMIGSGSAGFRLKWSE